MLKITRFPIGVASGEVELFNHFASDGFMWVGEGPREVATTVTFDQPFAATPVVQLGITALDASNSDNLRLNLYSRDVSKTGFTIAAFTWLETRIARLNVAWSAMGELSDEEYWDV